MAVVSTLSVFALNYALTGACQFSSVANKGYFTNLSFSSAIFASAVDAMRIAKAYLLGIPQESPRDLFYLPLVGAAFLWIGVFFRSWREVSWRELAWYLAMSGGVATVATSGWQNTNLDRYLVWTMPVLVFYMAFGADVVASRLKSGIAGKLPHLVLVVFSAAMAIVFVGIFHGSAARSDQDRHFAVRCEAEIPHGSSIGALSVAGLAYEMSPRRFAHISGILKNEPSTRFDYWFVKTVEKKSAMCDKPDVVAGATVLSCPPDFELRKADWSAYDAAEAVPSSLASDMTLCAHVDVAYEKDEKAYAYEALSRDDYPIFEPYYAAGELNGTNVVDGGRFLYGGDAMTVPLKPGRDVHVVMRTALKCSVATSRELWGTRSDFALKTPMTLKVIVDGEDAGDVSFPVSEGDFADVNFTVPGRFIASDSTRLAFLGEHVAFAYWFFQ